MRGSVRCFRLTLSAALLALIGAGTGAHAQWVEFADETALRLNAALSVGANNPDEKDYAFGDVDQDGDTDLVAVYKQGWTTTGRRRNVLFMNEGTAEGHAVDGVLVDRTAALIPSFLDLTNDRDVVVVDVNGDKWLDIVTATTLSGSQPKSISHPRVYINLGLVGGVWAGYVFDDVDRIPTMPVEPRFCAVAAGDVDDDGDQDLYFADYDQGPYARPADLNDRLLLNDGAGYFTNATATHMTQEMVLSAFGMAAAIADMNGDGTLDIIKDTALVFPQRVSISYNDADNEGFFDFFDVVYDNAPYHISVGELNNDNRLDIVVTDDGSDRYLLNQGNDAGGHATFIERTFNGSQPEFGGDSYTADLNNDGFNDVFITDVDVDSPGCGRQSKIYRNLGNVPSVTLQHFDNAGISTDDITGVHDVAIFDIDQNGWLDLVLGKCNGTRVYMNQPPSGLLFTYPQGIPFFVRPDTGTSFQVQVSPNGGAIPLPNSGRQYVSVNGGPFTQSLMPHLGGNLYMATLPAGNCTDRLRFYFSAQRTSGAVLFDPPTAPTSNYSAVLAVNTRITLRDEIEGDVSSWTIINDASLVAGGWEQADPNGTVFGTDQAAPEDDATQAANKVKAFVTGNGPPGGAAIDSDVDGGPTRLVSPVIDLQGTDATISYSRWFFCDNEGAAGADGMVVEVSNNAGASWTVVATVTGTDGEWRSASFLVGDYVTPTASVRVRFSVSDSPNDSVTEGGIDNFQVEQLVCSFCSSTAQCEDNDPCTDQVCNHGVCEYSDNSAFCNDNNPCTSNDICNIGNCIGTPIPGCVLCGEPDDCDDANVCTDDTCSGFVCSHTANSNSCDDNSICTLNDVCFNGACVGDLVAGCRPCSVNSDCDDGRFCNGAETCNGTTCDVGQPPCDQGQPCDELTDTCTLVLQARMGDPVIGLTAAELARFEIGKAQFSRVFNPGQGLGPVFNHNSCAQCHNDGASGGAGSTAVIRFGTLDKGGFDPLETLGGSLLQSQAISPECVEVVPPEANITALRITPPVFGAGLVEAVSDAAILDGFTNPPLGVQGFAHMVGALEDPQGSPLRVGRFGWKAQVATVLTFSADATLNEMGITNRFLTQDNAPNGDSGLLTLCDSVADPEDGPDGQGVHFIDRVTDFQRFLAPPPQTPKSGMTGESLLSGIGCTSCHRPQFVTGQAPQTALTNRTIQPYSDFLLHNMGTLSDGIGQGDAPGTHMRTAPLWGLRVRDPLLHDGSVAGGTFAERIHQVVMAHNAPGSSAGSAAAGFAALTVAEQNALISFLDSLGRAEFDSDGDDIVDISDFVAFRACFAGPNGYTPDNACAVSDIEQDGDVDLADFDMFLLAFDGTLADCDDNSVPDLRQILLGGPDCNQNFIPDGCEEDCDQNAIPDECDRASFGDIDDSGVVDLMDILCVLDGFGVPADCTAADLVPCGGDGAIDINDILAILDAFGGVAHCPEPC